MVQHSLSAELCGAPDAFPVPAPVAESSERESERISMRIDLEVLSSFDLIISASDSDSVSV